MNGKSIETAEGGQAQFEHSLAPDGDAGSRKALPFQGRERLTSFSSLYNQIGLCYEIISCLYKKQETYELERANLIQQLSTCQELIKVKNNVIQALETELKQDKEIILLKNSESNSYGDYILPNTENN